MASTVSAAHPSQPSVPAAKSRTGMRRLSDASVIVAPPVHDFDGVPEHGGHRGRHVAGGVLPNRAVSAEAAHEQPAAVGTVAQPLREGELLRPRV
jgi:hypothetical protein